MQTGRLEALIFDFDGTIADTMQHVLVVYNDVATRYDVPQIAPDQIPRLRSIGPKQAMAEYGVPFWKVPLVVQAVVTGLRERIHMLEPFAEVVELLTTIKRSGAKCCLLSSNSIDNVTLFLERHGIDVFDRLVCGASLFGKAARLRKLLKLAGLSRETTAYVGDEVRDIEAAKAVGMQSIAVSWGYAARPALVLAKPDRLFDAPAQLLAHCLEVLAKR